MNISGFCDTFLPHNNHSAKKTPFFKKIANFSRDVFHLFLVIRASQAISPTSLITRRTGHEKENVC